MVSDLDIWRAANLMMWQHGAAAELEAARLQDLMLSDNEVAALAQLLRRAINDDPYPLSPRLTPLKAILAKLDPPQPPSEPPPALQARDAPSAAGRRRRRG
jgi:hypothetical protein